MLCKFSLLFAQQNEEWKLTEKAKLSVVFILQLFDRCEVSQLAEMIYITLHKLFLLIFDIHV